VLATCTSPLKRRPASTLPLSAMFSKLDGLTPFLAPVVTPVLPGSLRLTYGSYHFRIAMGLRLARARTGS
jgi:hypothetical protein